MVLIHWGITFCTLHAKFHTGELILQSKIINLEIGGAKDEKDPKDLKARSSQRAAVD
jgi:hypothetical protein